MRWSRKCRTWTQILVDMDTPAEAMQEVQAAVAAHTAAHPGDFAVDAEPTAFIIACSDPLKLQLGIFVQYAHNGNPFVETLNPV